MFSFFKYVGGVVVGLMLCGIASAATVPSLHSVLKVVTYQEQALTADSYSEYAYGSAIALGGKHILTNAHVILDSEYSPMDHIAVCLTDDAFELPECPTTATVIAYDIDKDIALLEMADIVDIEPVTINQQTLQLGDYVQVLGYPSNGGGTITLTQGRISGKDRELYKIDANLDGGNSGGGAFNEAGEFIGMPVSVVRGYTTLGYMIPATDVQTFVDANRGSDVMGVGDDAFYDYIRGDYVAHTAGEIHNAFFSFEGFDRYGYEIADTSHIPSLGAYSYTFSSADQKTSIAVAVVPQNIAAGDPGYDFASQLDEIRRIRETVIYREGVSFMDREWYVLYMDGYTRSDQPNRALTLAHETEHHTYIYSIDSSTTSDTGLYNALRALVYGYMIHQYDTPVDLHQLGELILPDTLTISDPVSLGEGMKVSLSYGDEVTGNASYKTVNEAFIDTGSYDDIIFNPCEWMDEESNCREFWIENDNDIYMHITTHNNTYDDETVHSYDAMIIDKHQDEYVMYDISVTVDSDEYTEQVEQFLRQVDGEMEWVFDETPSTQRR